MCGTSPISSLIFLSIDSWWLLIYKGVSQQCHHQPSIHVQTIWATISSSCIQLAQFLRTFRRRPLQIWSCSVTPEIQLSILVSAMMDLCTAFLVIRKHYKLSHNTPVDLAITEDTSGGVSFEPCCIDKCSDWELNIYRFDSFVLWHINLFWVI